MRELNEKEVNLAAGSGAAFFAFIGDAIIDVDMIINDIFNSNMVSSIGRLSDSLGLGSVHYKIDSIGYAISKAAATIGTALGGDASRINYHFEQEWGA